MMTTMKLPILACAEKLET